MKKLNYFLTFVAGAMMLASCSHDKDVVDPTDNNAVQQIVLQVASNGDGLTTRAGRPLLSDEAAQQIDVVDIYIVSKDESDTNPLKYSKSVTWSDASKYDNGKTKTLTMTASEKLAAGSYTIYALGHTKTENSDYDIPVFTNDNIDDIKDCVLTYKTGKTTPEEIFAGSVNLEVPATRDFTKPIVLNRQVAGAYFYVYNLPILDGLTVDSELRLVASDYNDQLVLGNFANIDISGNGENNGNNVKYVVNGTKSGSTTEKVICKVRIGDWYKDIVDNDNDGIVDITYTVVNNNSESGTESETESESESETESESESGTETVTETTIINWISPSDDSKGKKYVKGSIFASNFIMPFKSVATEQTLKLVLANGDNILRTWNINLKNDTDAPSTLSYYGTNGWTLNETVSESKHCYSIVRNHLYSVGVRTSDGVPNPDDPNDPDNPDPDDPDNPDNPDNPVPDNNPEDLSKGQTLILQVNHNWEVIYRMELE